MVRRLKEVAPDIKPMQFRFSEGRPDLTKLDNVFGILSSDTMEFSKQIDEIENLFIEQDLENALQNLGVSNA